MKTLLYILRLAIIFALLQSCSIIGQYSTYSFSTKLKNEYEENYTSINVINGRINIFTNSVNSLFADIISFDVDSFDGGVILLSGLPYIPVIPNFLLPFNYHSNNKKSHFNITISTTVYDSLNINNFYFYRNNKEIIPEHVYISAVSSDSVNNEKSIITLNSNDLNYNIPHGKYHFSFTFKVRKMTTKTIEVKYNNETIIKVKRKKKLYHKMIFAS